MSSPVKVATLAVNRVEPGKCLVTARTARGRTVVLEMNGTDAETLGRTLLAALGWQVSTVRVTGGVVA